MKKNTTRITSLIIFTVIIFSFFGFSIAFAEDPALIDTMKKGLSNSALPGGGEDVETSTITIIGSIVQVFISIFGIIFMTLMIYAGYKWMLASGREEEVKKAKDTIRGAIIGLIVVVLAYAITYFISASLQAAYTN